MGSGLPSYDTEEHHTSAPFGGEPASHLLVFQRRVGGRRSGGSGRRFSSLSQRDSVATVRSLVGGPGWPSGRKRGLPCAWHDPDQALLTGADHRRTCVRAARRVRCLALHPHRAPFDGGGIGLGHRWCVVPALGEHRTSTSGTRPPNKRMQLTKLRAAPERRADEPPCT